MLPKCFEKYCGKCGKEFYPAYHHIYKRNKVYYCSYTCFRSATDTKRPKEVEVPNVGDVIEIRYMAGINSYRRKVGVVEFTDTMGQLHGTWGELVVIPGEDHYKIIRRKEE